MKKLVLILLLLSASTIAEVYKWTDENGRVHYGDNPVKGVAAQEVTTKINSYEHPTITELPPLKDPEEQPRSKQVIMYSTTWCSYCKKARNYFMQHSIAFTDYDIEHDTDAKQAYDRLGGRGVPVILVGQKRLDGFSPDSFEQLYK